MPSILTQRQENFCLNIFKGLTQRESWIQAGYSSKYALTWIDSHACSLANLGKIQARILELRAEVKSELVADEIERQRILSTIARTTPEVTPTPGHIISAIAELNKMDGVYDTRTINFNDIKVLVVREPQREMKEVRELGSGGKS